MFYKNKKCFILISLVIIALLIGIFFGLNVYKKLSYKYCYTGISIEGIDVSGLTKTQAINKIQHQVMINYNYDSIALLSENKKWIIPLENINYRFNIEDTANFAFKVGREGSWFSRLKIINGLEKTPINIVVAADYDKEKLHGMLTKIKKQIDFLGKSSTYDYNYGRIMYTSDIEGKNFDIDANTKLIESRLLNRNFTDINLEVKTIRPEFIVSDVKDIKDVLSTFTTNFNANNYNRAHNIELASKKINNYLVKPGEEFSMNLALGPRTTQNGYMQAPIILRNALVPGTGGGVCQVATTLYNSVLKAMLQVTSRVNHSIPPKYVPPSQDATISEGYIDLKFKNNRDYTICIVSEIKGSQITVKIIGKKRDDDPIVVLNPLIVAEYNPTVPNYVIDNSLPDNAQVIRIKERKGMKVILYRETYNKEGGLINKEIISEDIYKPLRGEIAMNQKTYEILKKLGVLT